MYFSFSTVLLLLSAPFLAFAQDQPNPFKIPESGLSATGGQALDLEWTPTTDGTVTLMLRKGASNNLSKGTVIAANIDNDGSYTWTPPDSLVSGTDYAVEIVDDANPDLVNYTPPFTIETTTTEATSDAPSATSKVSTANATGSANTVLTTAASQPTLPVFNTFTHNTPGGTNTDSSSPTAATAANPNGSSSSEAGAARATAMAAGMLGVALGALAL